MEQTEASQTHYRNISLRLSEGDEANLSAVMKYMAADRGPTARISVSDAVRWALYYGAIAISENVQRGDNDDKKEVGVG